MPWVLPAFLSEFKDFQAALHVELVVALAGPWFTMPAHESRPAGT